MTTVSECLEIAGVIWRSLELDIAGFSLLHGANSTASGLVPCPCYVLSEVEIPFAFLCSS